MRYDAEVNRAIRAMARRLYGAGKVTINVATEGGASDVVRHYAWVRVGRSGDEKGRNGRPSKSPSQARIVLARELATLLTRATIADAAVLRAIPSELRPPAKTG